MPGSTQNHVGSQISQDDAPVHKIEETSKSEGTQAGGTLQHTNVMQSKSISTGSGTRTKDYNNDMVRVLKKKEIKSTYHQNSLVADLHNTTIQIFSPLFSWFHLISEHL